MENLTKIIGDNLLFIRKQKGWSLEKVADITGVSKTMLGQIERGESNPTVSTLWKIANGLNVSFSYFIEKKEEDVLFIEKDKVKAIVEHDEKMRLFPLFPYDENRRFEVLTIELEGGCLHESPAHNQGVEEIIIVTKGQLQLCIGEKCYVLNQGDALRYIADKHHKYINDTDKITEFQNIIYYPQL